MKIKIDIETIQEGNDTSVTVNVDPKNIEPLFIALINDAALRQTTLLATSYIIATSKDSDETIKSIVCHSKEARKQMTDAGISLE